MGAQGPPPAALAFGPPVLFFPTLHLKHNRVCRLSQAGGDACGPSNTSRFGGDTFIMPVVRGVHDRLAVTE